MHNQEPLILIVDDDDSILTLLKLGIKNKGYRVEEATNGEEGITVYQRCQPDLVLLDAVMPVMDGFTCCQNLCQIAEENNQEISILMLTFLDDQKSIDQAFAAGATDYINKPIYWAVLFQRVSRLLNAHQKSLHDKKVTSELLQFQAYENIFRNVLHSDEQINQNILDEIRLFFNVDRVIFYSLKSKSSFQSYEKNMSGIEIEDIPNLTLLNDYNSTYKKGELLTIKAVDEANFKEDAIAFFNQYQVKSLAISPLNKKQQLFGLLGLYQSRINRVWEDIEKKRLRDLTQLLILKNCK